MVSKATVWGLLAAILLPATSVAGAEQGPLRIAMTLADIPLTDGAPDQGTEGLRFLGHTASSGQAIRSASASGPGSPLAARR